MILKGKRVLIAGMSDRRSIGFSIAQEAQRQGAELLLTSFGRMMSITQMTAKKLDPVPDILEMDVSKPSDIAEAVKETSKRWDRLDGMVHSVAFAPADALGGQFLNTPWESVATALQVSAFSFKELARGFTPVPGATGRVGTLPWQPARNPEARPKAPRRIFGAHAAHLRAQLLRCSRSHEQCACCAARRFARIWATWIAESLAEGFPSRP